MISYILFIFIDEEFKFLTYLSLHILFYKCHIKVNILIDDCKNLKLYSILEKMSTKKQK
jgi:hypothetical protein